MAADRRVLCRLHLNAIPSLSLVNSTGSAVTPGGKPKQLGLGVAFERRVVSDRALDLGRLTFVARGAFHIEGDVSIRDFQLRKLRGHPGLSVDVGGSDHHHRPLADHRVAVRIERIEAFVLTLFDRDRTGRTNARRIEWELHRQRRVEAGIAL